MHSLWFVLLNFTITDNLDKKCSYLTICLDLIFQVFLHIPYTHIHIRTCYGQWLCSLVNTTATFTLNWIVKFGCAVLVRIIMCYSATNQKSFHRTKCCAKIWKTSCIFINLFIYIGLMTLETYRWLWDFIKL